MQQLALPRTEILTTRMGYGCSILMGVTSRRESLALLEAAFDAGIRHFDVAPMYGFGAAEACLGEFLQSHPGQLTVTTKFGIPPARNRWFLDTARAFAKPLIQLAPGIKKRLAGAANSVAGTGARLPFTAQEARLSLEHSLRELRVDHIDIFLLHDAIAADLIDDDLLTMLQSAQSSGQIGAFGIGSDAKNMPPLLKSHPAYCNVLQCEWSILDAPLPPTAAFRIHHRALGESYRALSSALAASPTACTRWSEATGADLRSPNILADLMLRASLDHNPASIILFSSRSPSRISANVRISENNELAEPARRLFEIAQREGLPNITAG